MRRAIMQAADDSGPPVEVKDVKSSRSSKGLSASPPASTRAQASACLSAHRVHALFSASSTFRASPHMLDGAEIREQRHGQYPSSAGPPPCRAHVEADGCGGALGAWIAREPPVIEVDVVVEVPVFDAVAPVELRKGPEALVVAARDVHRAVEGGAAVLDRRQVLRPAEAAVEGNGEVEGPGRGRAAHRAGADGRHRRRGGMGVRRSDGRGGMEKRDGK
ncbi:unnamed protein product [Cutaneotrichosporon oleaginosum]